MKLKTYRLAFVLLLLLSIVLLSNNCLGQKANNQNSSVGKQNADSIYLQKQIDSLLATIQDTLERNIINASQQVFEAELALRKNIPNSPNVAELLIVHNKRGIRLHDALMKMYDVGIAYTKSSLEKQDFASKKEPNNTNFWLEKYFGKKNAQEALNSIDVFRQDILSISKLYSGKTSFM